MLGALYSSELQREAVSTRKMLERLPQNKLDWKPHPKSMTLGRLAAHVAEIPGYLTRVVTSEGIDFNPETYKPVTVSSVTELLQLFDTNLAEAVKALESASDADLMVNWTLSKQGTPMFTAPRVGALRGFGMSHMIHHRGQLSVYMRQLDIPVPSIYGPSADEEAVAQAA